MSAMILITSDTDAILESLSFEGIKRYLERPLDSQPGTFEWLFDPSLCRHRCERCAPRGSGYPWISSRYSRCECRQIERKMQEHVDRLQQWLQSSNDIFWIYGKAGSGKSTLMKFLFEHEQTRLHLDIWARGKVTIAASFFWSAGSDLEKSHVGLLRALLYQVLDQHPELIQLIFPERWRAVLKLPTQQKPWTQKELLIALKLLSHAPTSRLRLFFLIDGLDEFSGDHRDLIESLQELNNSPAIKICVSSRPWIVFESAYGSNENCSMELHNLTVRDIDIYIVTRLESLRGHGVLTEEELKVLGDEVRTGARGVFLWVILAVKDLRRGIGKRDSMFVLQKRLANYPSELHDFYQHILDSIDPVYRTFTGRLLLAMLVPDQRPDVICLHLWMKHGLDSDAVHDTKWCPKSGPELHRLMEQGESCVRNWVGDLVNPTPTHVSCASPDSCDCTVDTFIGEAMLSFSHRTVYQFVQQKADDGTLAQMAGPGFEPLLAYLYLSLGFTKYCKTIDEFARIVEYHLLEYHPERSGLNNALSVEPIAQAALAFDRIGQQITRPIHWTHWTINQLYKDVPRSPLDYQHSSTLMSYMLTRRSASKVLVGALLELQSHSITAGQRRFLLESAFIPGLYIDDQDVDDDRWPQRIVTELIKTLIDVNEPVRRVKCSLDYSTWQIFLLWLHDSVCFYRDWEQGLGPEIQEYIPIFQTFMSCGADPCAVILTEDLETLRPLIKEGSTLRQNAALLSATELLEIGKSVGHSATDAKDLYALVDSAQALLADATQRSS
jgi:hypothetical protein